ncbi:MAG: hypothetical protein WD960_13515 [Gemmatimonadota bacterium]
MQHLDDGYLQSWLDRDRSGITGAEAAEVEAHVAHCKVCAARLAEMEGTNQQVRSLLASVAPGAEAAPDFDEVVRRSRRRSGSGGDGRGWMAAGWAASIVLATGLGWLSHDVVRPGSDDRASAPAAETEAAVAAADLPAARAVQDLDDTREAEEAGVGTRGTGAEARDTGTVGADVAAAEWAAGATAVGDGTEVAAADPEREIDATGVDSVSVEALLGQAAISVEGLMDRGAAREPVTAALQARSLRAREGGEPAGEARDVINAAGTGEFWAPVARERAEAGAGFALLTVPGLAVLEIEFGAVGGVTAIRVRQALDSGAVLTLVQWKADGGELEPTLPDGQAVVTVELGEVRVRGAAPVAADSLRRVVAGVR